jgi:PIN domain nuclease of toxin-antitoxin system
LNFLADACALIAFHGYRGQTMSGAGKVAMSHGDVLVSPATVWEISRKVALGKLAPLSSAGFGGSLSEWLRHTGYRVMPLNWDDCERANALPMHHKDPMDRMLIATALDRDMTVISDDEMFGRYGVSTVW